ncbi:MAG: alkaline phosphatase, partial [Pseudonocardia sp.]
MLRAAALLVLAGCAAGDPFTLGVASGDPTPDGVLLWTRLATDPLAPDGLGGLGARRTDVQWQLAEDDRFARVVASGTATTGPERGHAVHVEVAGLSAGREYFYRFRAGGALSPAGRTRTTPAPGSLTPLTVCVASCAQYEHGYYTAYRHLAQDAPDLVLHLGDYIYEEAPGAYRVASGSVRLHTGGEARTLADYRVRHAQYRSDPDLQAAHAAAPWLAVYDDHEVADDWAGDRPAVPDPGFAARR